MAGILPFGKRFYFGNMVYGRAGSGIFGASSYKSVLNQNLKEFMIPAVRSYMQWTTIITVLQTVWKIISWLLFSRIRYLLSRDGNLDSSKYEKLEQFGDIYL